MNYNKIKLTPFQKIKALILALGFTNKCPLCDKIVMSSYKYNRCGECGFGFARRNG